MLFIKVILSSNQMISAQSIELSKEMFLHSRNSDSSLDSSKYGSTMCNKKQRIVTLLQ